MRRRSIGTPLTIGIVLALLVIALAIGWQVLVWTGARPPSAGLGNLSLLRRSVGSDSAVAFGA